MKITKSQLEQMIESQLEAAFSEAQSKFSFQEEMEKLKEDGHQDVHSAVRAMKTIIEDAGQMLEVLESMDSEQSLPTWWTNKMAVSANNLNKIRDYLLVDSEEKVLDEEVY